jgi:release factor glutamine methyltransferase
VTSTWRGARAEVTRRLGAAGYEHAATEARFMTEEASGYGATEWLEAADRQPPPRAEARLFGMLERRLRGEPLQYALGSWSFRGIDLMVDRRVLVPRPETEVVVEVALEEAQRTGLRRARATGDAFTPSPEAVVADLGTGSGAIALALAAELPEVEVWATDAHDDALAVARANVAGCAAARVRLALGSWFEPLPIALRGGLSLVVSNPPYISEAEFDELPDEVAAYEPRHALVAGPTGREAVELLLDRAFEWLAPGAAFVCEIAPHQADALVARAGSAGYIESFVRDDFAGRPRVLVARTG